MEAETSVPGTAWVIEYLPLIRRVVGEAYRRYPAEAVQGRDDLEQGVVLELLELGRRCNGHGPPARHVVECRIRRAVQDMRRRNHPFHWDGRHGYALPTVCATSQMVGGNDDDRPDEDWN